MNKLTILYPFIESGFNEYTPSFIEEIAWIKRSRKVDVLITVDQEGKISRLLKQAGLAHEEVAFSYPVGVKDFYLSALFKLIRSALPLFFYFRSNKIDIMHCPDLISLLCWGNPARMNRVRFIVSVDRVEKFSHYTSLMLTDASKIICQNEDVRLKMPSRFSASALMAPRAQDIPENLNEDTMRKNTVDFWTNVYASLYARPDMDKITGLLNNN